LKYIQSVKYIIDEQKISKHHGVIFKTQMGIHFEDIDYIGKKFGVINKIFSTGDITINTVGSSATDLRLHALKDINPFYEALKKNYQEKPK